MSKLPKMSEEEKNIEKLAEEKADEEALALKYLCFLPIVLVACIMAVLGVPSAGVLSTSFVGLMLGYTVYFITKKKLYEKYLQELMSHKGEEDEK